MQVSIVAMSCPSLRAVAPPPYLLLGIKDSLKEDARIWFGLLGFWLLAFGLLDFWALGLLSFWLFDVRDFGREKDC
jgi:hypothetical protein